ncbi:MAG TPA: DUF1653 domain-containing protein [Lachnospiraceae bacterium]|nr:DUF1653 domain-containing protein [Lachnospiraceae bacterium]
MRKIQQGQFYRHFKDRLYQIVAVAEHSETGEPMVVYQALYGNYGVYVRPYEMFVSEVDHEKYPEVTQKYRFELVEMPSRPEAVQDTTAQDPENEAKDTRQNATGEVNPILIEFLDADTLEEKMHIMVYNRNRMDANLLNSIAISLDLVVEKENVQEMYDEILNCLSMMEKFECNRFR